MTTNHMRHRRMLSMHRRTGLQVPPDIGAGRHQRTYRDLHLAEDDAFATARRIIDACIVVGLTLSGVCVIAVGGVVLFDDIIPAMVEAVRLARQ